MAATASNLSPPRILINSELNNEMMQNIEHLTMGPYARAEYREAGWIVTNPAITSHPRQELFIPNQVLCEMTNTPLLMEVFSHNPQSKEHDNPQTAEAAKKTINQLDTAMRMRNAAKKVTWLERNKYPPHKPRKYWPPTFYIHDPVAKQDVICMQCRSRPFQQLQQQHNLHQQGSMESIPHQRARSETKKQQTLADRQRSVLPMPQLQWHSRGGQRPMLSIYSHVDSRG